MSLRQQLAFWLATLLIVVLLLWLLADVLLPFVAGAALAYLLSPLVDRLEPLGLSRTLGALIVIGVVVLVLILIVLFLVPILIDQLLGLLSRTPAYYQRLLQTLEELPWLNQFLQQGDPKTAIEQLVNQATAVRGLAWLWSGGKSVVSFFRCSL
jgi:predicted PurR-regulated permease PerM